MTAPILDAVAAIDAIADGVAASVPGAAVQAEAIRAHCLAIRLAFATLEYTYTGDPRVDEMLTRIAALADRALVEDRRYPNGGQGFADEAARLRADVLSGRAAGPD